jgi:hypothetical protein
MQVCLLSFRTQSFCGWREDRTFSVVGVEDNGLVWRGQMYVIVQACNVWDLDLVGSLLLLYLGVHNVNPTPSCCAQPISQR